MKTKFAKFNEINNLISFSDDIKTREVKVSNKTSAKILFVHSLVNISLLSKNVVTSLLNIPKKEKISAAYLKDNILTNSIITLSKDSKELLNLLFSGNALLFLPDDENVLAVSVIGFENRSITEPPTSAVLRGPREGFIEDLSTNISLIRRRLKSEHLVVKNLKIGEISNTDIAIIYLNNVAEKKVVNEILKTLKNINIDGVIDSYYIQSFLENPHNKFFKQVGNSEKPDIVSAKILEGRVAILVNGSPIVLTLPYILFEDFQSADDYFMHPYRASFLRCLRLLGVFLAIMLPGIYVAMQSFHYSIFPSNFLVSLLNSIEALSLPPLIEILFVLFLFEILYEASIRMPKYLGMALSIVGALILGDTAVKAGLISSPSVMMVAISGICMYTVPDQVSASSLLRVIFTVLGGVAGFYGIILGVLFLSAYLVGMDNFGAPYLAPFAPYIKSDQKDALFKQDIKNMIKRPKSIPNINQTRMKNDGSN